MLLVFFLFGLVVFVARSVVCVVVAFSVVVSTIVVNVVVVVSSDSFSCLCASATKQEIGADGKR